MLFFGIRHVCLYSKHRRSQRLRRGRFPSAPTGPCSANLTAVVRSGNRQKRKPSIKTVCDPCRSPAPAHHSLFSCPQIKNSVSRKKFQGCMQKKVKIQKISLLTLSNPGESTGFADSLILGIQPRSRAAELSFVAQESSATSLAPKCL